MVKNDLTEDKFIHCAASGNACVIISGDQHVFKLKPYKTTTIQTPADFLAAIA